MGPTKAIKILYERAGYLRACASSLPPKSFQHHMAKRELTALGVAMVALQPHCGRNTAAVWPEDERTL